ncbi:MAG TPA: nuclear transport factor 2 family protein [Candidatus Angelobacter sp.]
MRTFLAVLMCLLGAAAPASSQTPSGQDEATHNQLRALRDGLIDAMNKGDFERELTYLHPNVVVTWHNAEVSRGRDGVRAYLNRMMGGANKVVAGYSADVKVDELTILYGGDTGISFGSAIEHFKLANGSTLDLPARWSATLVKEGDNWMIASLHASDNLFDNPLLAMAQKTAYWAGGIALVVGLIIGLLLGRRRTRAA